MKKTSSVAFRILNIKQAAEQDVLSMEGAGPWAADNLGVNHTKRADAASEMDALIRKDINTGATVGGVAGGALGAGVGGLGGLGLAAAINALRSPAKTPEQDAERRSKLRKLLGVGGLIAGGGLGAYGGAGLGAVSMLPLLIIREALPFVSSAAKHGRQWADRKTTADDLVRQVANNTD